MNSTDTDSIRHQLPYGQETVFKEIARAIHANLADKTNKAALSDWLMGLGYTSEAEELARQMDVVDYSCISWMFTCGELYWDSSRSLVENLTRWITNSTSATIPCKGCVDYAKLLLIIGEKVVANPVE